VTLIPLFYHCSLHHPSLHSFPTRRSSDLLALILLVMPSHARLNLLEIDISSIEQNLADEPSVLISLLVFDCHFTIEDHVRQILRSEEHTSELQSRGHLVCRLLLEKKKTQQ